MARQGHRKPDGVTWEAAYPLDVRDTHNVRLSAHAWIEDVPNSLCLVIDLDDSRDRDQPRILLSLADAEQWLEAVLTAVRARLAED